MPSTNNPVPAPVRLSPIIRAPDREANNTQRRVKHKQKPPVKQEPLFTIYVNSSICKHSVDLMREIRDVYRVPCTVIDVASGVSVPTWLKGTPSIVVGTDVYCGDTAFDFVASIGETQETRASPDSSVDQATSFQDIISGESSKKRNDGIGCGLSMAFCEPVQISEEEAEKKYSVSVDDVMSRLMQSRG